MRGARFDIFHTQPGGHVAPDHLWASTSATFVLVPLLYQCHLCAGTQLSQQYTLAILVPNCHTSTHLPYQLVCLCIFLKSPLSYHLYYTMRVCDTQMGLCTIFVNGQWLQCNHIVRGDMSLNDNGIRFVRICSVQRQLPADRKMVEPLL